MHAKVAKVIDPFTLVLNKGAKQDIKIGQRFLVYTIGDEIFDPETSLSLGKLEIVKGTGKITHVQDNISTLGSDMKTSPSRTVRRITKPAPSLVGIGDLFRPSSTEEMEEQLPAQRVAFENPEVGDHAKPV